MPNIVLLPDWSAAATGGLIDKVKDPDDALPGAWSLTEDEIKNLEAFAFPTPFAWAEMMALVVRQGLYEHRLFKYYEQLCFGVILGLLEVEINDLRANASGEIGQVLSGSDERYRYFGLLRGAGRERSLQDKVFGATSPETLFWPAPRLNDADWHALDDAITLNGNRDKAFELLADLRNLMMGQSVWNPDEALWMKALQHILGMRPHSNNHKIFHAHSRTVGPVLVNITRSTKRPLYFPVYHEDFASGLMRALTGTFRSDDGAVSIVDGRAVAHLEVALPSVPPDGDRVLAGAGTVRVLSTPGMITDFRANRINFAELLPMLQPLDEALGRDRPLYTSLDRSPVRDAATVMDFPFFYPDIVRIPIARLGEAGVRNSEVSFSDHAFELALNPDSPGLPLSTEMDNQPHTEIGFRLSYQDRRRHNRRALYVEEYGGHSVNDLRALGWVLWSVFTGGAQFADGAIKDQSLTVLMADDDEGRPFSVTDRAYESVAGEAAPEDRRLAALQRFVKAFAARGAAANATDAERLCYAAALRFALWVFPDQQPILGNGHSARMQEIVTGGIKVNLAIDN